MTDPLLALIDATWPAAQTVTAGGFRLRIGQGGGSRVSSATLDLPLDQADIDAAIACHRAHHQTPLFMIRTPEDALDAALAARGFALQDPTVEYRAPLETLAGDIPPVTAFAHWPPLAIATDLWAENGIGPERQAIMARAAGPKTCILGRSQDRAAGVAFVAIHDRTAMLHALVIADRMRRQGLARHMLREASRWALAQGAHDLSLVVRTDNAPAVALYQALGMTRGRQYHYRIEVPA